MNLKDRVAVITGASSGIGEAVAIELSAAGAKVVLTARRGERLSRLSQQLAGESAWLAADVADPATPQRLLSLALERFGRADALVNNAGALAMGPLDDLDLEAAAHSIRVNFEAVMRASYVFGRAFKAQGSGAIVNVSSVAAFGLRPEMGVYAAAKAAVESFTGSLRIELGAHGVKVGAVAPGATQTDMLDDMLAHRGLPPSKTAVQPADMAAAVRFMLEQPDRANVAGLQLYSASSAV